MMSLLLLSLTGARPLAILGTLCLGIGCAQWVGIPALVGAGVALLLCSLIVEAQRIETAKKKGSTP